MLLEFITLLAMYIALGTAVAITSRRFGIKSTREYFVAGYRLGGFLAAMTYAATTYSAFMVVGLVGYTYSTGVGALGFELAYLIATLAFLALLAPKVWLMARERGWVSVSEMFTDLYGGGGLGMLVAATYLIALIPYTSAQMIGVGSVFEGLGAGYDLGVFTAAALTLLWIAIAGVWSVASTDAYQGLWMITAALMYVSWVALHLLPTSGLSMAKASEILGRLGLTGITPFWSLSTFLAFTIPWIFFAVTNPQVVQRLYMPVSEKALRRLIQYFAIYGLAYTVAVTLVGLLARSLSEVGVLPLIGNSDLVTPTLLLKAHPALASFIYVSIVAAAVSTANSIILSVASSFVRDFYERRVSNVSPRKSFTIANAVVAALVIAATLIAYLRPGFVVEMSVLSSVILLPLAPVTLAGWLYPSKAGGRVTYYGAVTALLVGVGLALWGALTYGPRKAFLTNLYGLPLSAWILITSSAITIASYALSSYPLPRGVSKEVRH